MTPASAFSVETLQREYRYTLTGQDAARPIADPGSWHIFPPIALAKHPRQGRTVSPNFPIGPAANVGTSGRSFAFWERTMIDVGIRLIQEVIAVSGRTRRKRRMHGDHLAKFFRRL